jgi:hypothetical protein
VNYLNKKGNLVEVEISFHSLSRFLERFNRIAGPEKIRSMGEARETIESIFKTSKRINPKGKHYEKRMRRHGEDSMYFVSACGRIIFIIQRAVLMTVELHGDARSKNRGNWI